MRIAEHRAQARSPHQPDRELGEVATFALGGSLQQLESPREQPPYLAVACTGVALPGGLDVRLDGLRDLAGKVEVLCDHGSVADGKLCGNPKHPGDATVGVPADLEHLGLVGCVPEQDVAELIGALA